MNETLGNNLFDLKDDTSIDSKLSKLLSLVRKHLNMEVAFISEFIENERVFKFVDNQTSNTAVQVGNADIMCETYCQKIADNKFLYMFIGYLLIYSLIMVALTNMEFSKNLYLFLIPIFFQTLQFYADMFTWKFSNPYIRENVGKFLYRK